MAGKRDSEWMVVRRCLELVLCIMRGDAQKQDLIDIVMSHTDPADEPLSRKSAEKRFENDRVRLRENLNWDFGFRPEDGVAYFKQSERPFIDMSPQAIRGLAFLRQSFGSRNTPFFTEISALTETMLLALSDARRHEVETQRALIKLDLQPRDGDDIPTEVFEKIRTACAEHRLLEFDYYSPKQSDRAPRRHTVKPFDYYFDDGHYYLDAECQHILTPKGPWRPPNPMSPYRIGHMNNVDVLPDKFDAYRRPVRTVEVRYWLAPEIARRGVTHRFAESKVEMQEDSSAIITFQSKNLFMDLRELLHYGGNCRVLGGDQALREMKTIVASMWRHYETL